MGAIDKERRSLERGITEVGELLSWAELVVSNGRGPIEYDEMGLPLIPNKAEALIQRVGSLGLDTACHLAFSSQEREQASQVCRGGRLGVPLEVAEEKLEGPLAPWGYVYLRGGIPVIESPRPMNGTHVGFAHDQVYFLGVDPWSLRPDRVMGIRGIPGEVLNKPENCLQFAPEDRHPLHIFSHIWEQVQQGAWLYVVGASIAAPSFRTRMGTKMLRYLELLPLRVDFPAILEALAGIDKLPPWRQKVFYTVPAGLALKDELREYVVGNFLGDPYVAFRGVIDGFSEHFLQAMNAFLGKACPEDPRFLHRFVESSDRALTIMNVFAPPIDER
jgi:hypothetical protein